MPERTSTPPKPEKKSKQADRGDPRQQPASGVAADDPAMQGEGNYTAARRHRESVRDFVGSGQVEEAARKAAPDDADEARELKKAEEAGLAHARK